MKKQEKETISKDIIKAMFDEAKINKVEYIILLKHSTTNTTYKVRANNAYYLLKVGMKDESTLLRCERGLLKQEVKGYEIINKNTDIKMPHMVYSNVENSATGYPFIIMQYLVSSPLKELKIQKTDREQISFDVGELMGKLSKIKVKGYGYIQNGLELNWYNAIRKMVSDLIEDSQTYNVKVNKRLEKLLEYIDGYQSLLILVSPSFVHFYIQDSHIFYLNSTEHLWIIDPANYMQGDTLMELTAYQANEPLAKKTFLLDGYNSQIKLPIEINHDIAIRYYISLAYRGLLLDLKTRIHKTDFLQDMKNKQAANKMISLAFKELKKLEKE